MNPAHIFIPYFFNTVRTWKSLGNGTEEEQEKKRNVQKGRRINKVNKEIDKEEMNEDDVDDDKRQIKEGKMRRMGNRRRSRKEISEEKDEDKVFSLLTKSLTTLHSLNRAPLQVQIPETN
jgi:hypothetical protein